MNPLKVGESFGARAMPIPSQARKREGVETRRAAPKSWSSPGHGEGIVQTTNAERRRRKPKWDETWGRVFESRRGRHFLRAQAWVAKTCEAICASFATPTCLAPSAAPTFNLSRRRLVAEDYATLAKDPGTPEQVLQANQVKETRGVRCRHPELC